MQFGFRFGVVVVVCSCVAALASAQSLAEIAKQRPKQKASRVITNDEIPPAQIEEPKGATTAASGSTTSSAAEDEENSKPEQKQNFPVSESPELQQLNQQLAKLEANIAERQQGLEAHREKTSAETNEFRRNAYLEVQAAMESDLKKMDLDREKLKQQIEAKQKEKGKKQKQVKQEVTQH